jgi:hypothetical protein
MCEVTRVVKAFVAAAAAAAALMAGQAVAQVVPTPTDAVLTEARQAYEATEYERARTLLDAVIAGLGAAPASPEQRQAVAGAYELRARTRFNLRDVDGARTDFRAMLLLNPSYLLAAEVNPRVLELFEEVRKTTIGTVSVAVRMPKSC